MCIDNFNTWLEIAKVTLKDKKIESILKECWDNAFQAGKEDRDEEVEELKEQIKYLETDNYEWEEHCNRLEEELEDAQQ